MNRLLRAAVIAATLFYWPRLGATQDEVLTLNQALARARERAPIILSAKARIDEARGRLAGASVLLRDSPLIETAAGHRRLSEAGSRDSAADVEVGISQTFELGGRRQARIAGAEAGLVQEIASSDDALRRLLRDVANAFVRVLHAEERLRLTTAAERVTADIGHTAERRYHAGDISILDVNVARGAAARAHSDVLAAEAARESALGDLQVFLGMRFAEPLAVRGDLRDRRRYTLQDLLVRAPERPDLRALEAGIQEAQAEVRLGEGLRWPDVTLGFRYLRETPADVATLGTLTFTLPVFTRGQELRATGAARARRLRQELETGRRVVDSEVQSAFAVYRHRVEAVEELERRALPVLDDNEALARRSYEAGRMSLAEFLLLRRETLETRVAYLDRLLEAALAGIELEARAGVLP
jgi:cobalt-zinc-cadmium efflux system outer membrane protein